MPKRAHLNFSQGGKVHWVLGPYFTEANKAGHPESVQQGGFRALPSLGIHTRAAVYTKEERADLLNRLSTPH